MLTFSVQPCVLHDNSCRLIIYEEYGYSEIFLYTVNNVSTNQLYNRFDNFIKINKITSIKKFKKLEPLFKLQVL